MTWFLFYSLFSVIHDIAHPDPPFKLCDTANFPDNSPYRANLDALLASVSSTTVPPSKFFKTSEGTGSDTIYARFMCYTYASHDQCQTCMQAVQQDVRKLCMYKYEAVVWEEYCLFHYSTQDYLPSQLNFTGNIPLDNKKNVTEPDRFRSVVNDTLHNLKKSAAFNPSLNMHSNGSKPFMENSTLYAFVQCSIDLSADDCNSCLERAIEDILGCCYYSRGARLLSRGCFLRYELYAFYEGDQSGQLPSQNPVPPETEKQIHKKWMVAGISSISGVLALSALGCWFYCFVTRRQTRKKQRKASIDGQEIQSDNLGTISGGHEINLDPKEFPFIEMKIVEEATDNFSIKLGEGGFGPVFKGTLPNGQDIAVKKLASNSDQGRDEFINEVLLIHKLQHVNLVRLLGFCIHHEEKLLIYEYMPNGSLDAFLWDSRKRSQLNWNIRLNIIDGIARGLQYLHQDSRLNIVHRDLKPGNVLLDVHMNPKISDFGTARIFRGTDGEANTARIVGTLGYIAPECATDGLYSVKTDVFSFGVLLLEIITGKRNHNRNGNNLLACAWNLWSEGRGIELIDPLLDNERSCSSPDKFLKCMHIGLLCVQRDSHSRPSMSSVVLMLNSETVPTLCQPKPPASTTVGIIMSSSNQYHETFVNNLSMNGLTISNLLSR